jgi:hypothetical protein
MQRLKTLALVSVWLSLCLAACAPAKADVVVEWTTANEVNTAGFNLYRSESPDGPYAQVNSNLIPASSDPLAGGQYQYRDDSVQPGRTYYYQLEDVEYNGATTRHGPIQVTASGANATLILGLAAGAGLAGLGAATWLARRRAQAAPRQSSHEPEKQTAGL